MISLCVCNCLWVILSAKSSPLPFLFLFLFFYCYHFLKGLVFLQYVHQMPVANCVFLRQDQVAKSIFSSDPALHFLYEVGATEMIRFCSFWQEEKESELKTGAEPWPLMFYDGCQHACHTITGYLVLPHSRVIFLIIFPHLDIVFYFCFDFRCLPALSTWDVILLFQY